MSHFPVTTDVDGVMENTDKSKLDGVAPNATNTPLTTTVTPEQIDVGDAGSFGASTDAARADHAHALPAPGAPADVTKAAAAAGSSTNVARQDHKHDVSTAAPGGTSLGLSPAEGTETTLSRSDHIHQSNTSPADVTKASALIGTSGEPARADHKHDITTAAPGATSVGTASADGAATTLARSDHVHQSNTSPADVTKAAAAIGTSGEPARADHKHDVSTAAPAATGVATASSEGTATTLARSDHAHQSNTAPADVTKAAAVIGTSGEPARADHKHDVSVGTPVAVGSANAEGTATSLSRSDHVHQNSSPIATVSTTTTLDSSYGTVLANSSGGAFTITLPAAASHTGRIYEIKKISSDTNIVTIDANGTETIDGALDWLLRNQYETMVIRSNGTEWNVLVVPKNYQIASSTARSTTTSSTYQTKVTLTTPALRGTFRIEWCAVVDSETLNKTVQSRLYNTTDAAVVGAYQDNRVSTGGLQEAANGFATITFTGTAKSFEVQFASQDNTSTVGIQAAYLEIRRIP